jgi:neutral ceramidase
MYLKYWLIGVGAGLLVVGTAFAQAGSAGKLLAGAAEVDITPPVSALRMPSDIIRDHLFVHAIYFANGDACGALVGVDQGATPTKIVEDALKGIHRFADCPAANIIISGTHTHSGSTGGIFDRTGMPTPDQVTSAIISAVQQAKVKSKPARVGYANAQINMSVNRDDFRDNMWMSDTNPFGPSDKTLSVVSFVGNDDMPIAIYMNYAAHPTLFYDVGVISADFPGAAVRYVERRYIGTIAVFANGTTGDAGPLSNRQRLLISSIRSGIPDIGDMRVGSMEPNEAAALNHVNVNDEYDAAMKKPLPEKDLAAYKEAVEQEGEFVDAIGAMLGEATIGIVKHGLIALDGNPRIAGAQETVVCPGRDRIDRSARQGVLPLYKDGDPVHIKLGLLRIGDINIASIDGEAYAEIGLRTKAAIGGEPLFIGLANGMANSGYIYSDRAGGHLTFEVIGSRLKPGCAENAIVNAAVNLSRQLH